MKRLLTRIVIQATTAMFIWYGGFAGVAWMTNVLKFYVWLIFFLAIFMVLSVGIVDKQLKTPEMRKKPIMGGFLNTIDFTLALGIAAVGWTFTAIAYVLTTLCFIIVVNILTKKPQDV